MPSQIKDSVEDFHIKEASKNYYEVTYTSPTTGKKWTKVTDCKEIIKNIEQGKSLVSNLKKLKFICKL